MNQKQTQELELLFDQSPSVLRNSALVLILRICGWILGLVFFGLGISLFFESFDQDIVSFFIADSDLKGNSDPVISTEKLEQGLAILFFVMSLLFFIVVRLCKMIMKRNGFVLKLFGWFEELK